MDEHAQQLRIEVQDVDHLGIVAGIVDEIGLVEEIDRQLGTHPQEHLSCGQAVKAMILNGLGFLSAPLYLFEEFFVGKATEHLIGTGIRPQHLNDDKLGRVLDKLFETDLSEVFVGVAMKAARRFGISPSSVHLDATSLHLHGEYAEDDQEGPAAIRITHGYSRDRRPDLKQFVVDLLCTGESGVPLFLRVADGNEADQAVFASLLKGLRARIDLDALFVADSALYGAQNLSLLGTLRWLCRVPRTLEQARRVLAQTPREAFVQSDLHEGYLITELENEYGGIKQRWLVVHSAELEKAAGERLHRRLERRERELDRELSRLGRKTFACRADAREATEALAAEHLGKHHRLADPEIVTVARYGKRGRPAKGTEPEEIRYRIKAELKRDEAFIGEELRRSGCYILATNVTDKEELSGDQLLAEYKDQHFVERGFRFLKDPLFFTSSVFVKSPRRVAAIAMVMGLCLLVYTLGERMLRRALQEAGTEVRHQTGKPTDRPTLRWVFQIFQAVHLLRVDGTEQIANLSGERESILRHFGRASQRYYLLS